MKKRMLTFTAMMLWFSLFASAQNFVFTVGGNYLSPADSEFKTRFGDTKYYPEGKIALRFSGNLYLWGSCGFFSTRYNWVEWSNKGVINADIEAKDVLDKLIISGGVGYAMGFIRPHDFSVRVEVGACSITDSVETTKNDMDSEAIVSVTENKESGIGFRGNLGITYGLYKNFFAEISAGFLYATDKVNDKRVNLGGFRLALGLGIAL